MTKLHIYYILFLCYSFFSKMLLLVVVAAAAAAAVDFAVLAACRRNLFLYKSRNDCDM